MQKPIVKISPLDSVFKIRSVVVVKLKYLGDFESAGRFSIAYEGLGYDRDAVIALARKFVEVKEV